MMRAYFQALKASVLKRSPLYTFGISDMLLYVNELSWKTYSLTIKQVNKLWVKLRINNEEYYWPSHFSTQGLEWIYNEVNYSFLQNPASYSHPHFPNLLPWVIDAGAGEGFYIKKALLKSNCVVAVEPNPTLQQALSLTFKKAIHTKQLHLIPAALGAKKTTGSFTFDTNHTYDATLLEDEVGGYTVNLETLDHIAQVYPLRGRGLIKMDIEGYEMKALMGASKLLKAEKPFLAIAVYHEHNNARECKEIILKANPGYTVQFRGMYGWLKPVRPYMLFAW